MDTGSNVHRCFQWRKYGAIANSATLCVHFWVVLPCSDSFSVVSVLISFYHAKHVLEVNAIQQAIHGIYIKTAQLSIHMTNGLFEAADEHINTFIYWNCCAFSFFFFSMIKMHSSNKISLNWTKRNCVMWIENKTKFQ